MAINTAEKRRSLSFLQGMVPGVTPNASHDLEWRYQAGYSYSGVAVEIIRTEMIFGHMQMDDLSLNVGSRDDRWLAKIDNASLNLTSQDEAMRLQIKDTSWNVKR